ncbi:hypothetical protein FF38_03002 [Lucilia cuprina]|uniref:Uncharacterized protein n=1 Tax=Lucilia cuprina TaxID=7375 RepID=A0A0L0BY15_LUCCU|nr:hypothetical protein FF38_03002 [Lucilia cuprina]
MEVAYRAKCLVYGPLNVIGKSEKQKGYHGAHTAKKFTFTAIRLQNTLSQDHTNDLFTFYFTNRDAWCGVKVVFILKADGKSDQQPKSADKLVLAQETYLPMNPIHWYQFAYQPVKSTITVTTIEKALGFNQIALQETSTGTENANFQSHWV